MTVHEYITTKNLRDGCVFVVKSKENEQIPSELALNEKVIGVLEEDEYGAVIVI